MLFTSSHFSLLHMCLFPWNKMKKAQKGKVLEILFHWAVSGHRAQRWLILQWLWLLTYILFIWLAVSDPFKTSDSTVTFLVVSLSKFIYDFLKTLTIIIIYCTNNHIALVNQNERRSSSTILFKFISSFKSWLCIKVFFHTVVKVG